MHERAERLHDAPAWSSPLTAALANCGVGLWWIDSHGVFSADGTLLSMWGRSAEELQRADSDAPVCFIHSEDREAAEAVFGRGSQIRIAAERLIRVVLPDGSWRHVLCRRDASDDDVNHAAGIAIDLTSVRRAEDARLRGRAFSTVSTLAARLAHDFNNLLFAILGNATLALGTMQLAVDHPVRESLREIERAGTRASDIVQRLSAFARPVQPRRQTVRIGALVDAAARTLRDKLPAQLTLGTQVPANEPSVFVDPRLVQELVSNLVANAVQAMEGRTGAIAVEVEPVVLDAQPWMFELGLKPGRYMEVRVRDLGAGMDAATLEHCAEPFFSTRPKGGGMGLGLCIAQGVARSHGGGMRIESEPAQGTTVQVFFPQ